MSAPNENSPFRSDQETSIKYYSIQELSNKRARMKKSKGFLDRDASNASSFKVTLLQVFLFLYFSDILDSFLNCYYKFRFNYSEFFKKNPAAFDHSKITTALIRFFF